MMTFAENNRISHRQLYRQLILTFTAPFLLCLFQTKRLGGVTGILGTVGAIVLLLFYVIFLIRLTPRFENLRKSCGEILAWGNILFFLGYTILTNAYLVSVLMEIVPESLLEGVSEIWIGILAVIVCAHGSYRGMQRRGRMAEISGALLLGVILLMMLLSLGQAKLIYLQEMIQRSSRSAESLWKNGYGVICAFSGIALLPFLLIHVEKPGSAWKPAVLGILTVGAILEGMLLLLPAVFGWDRLKAESMPILPLLSEANLPGKILARFDVLWMGFVLYGLLYTIGSLFHYSNQIISVGLGKPAKDREKEWEGEYQNKTTDYIRRSRSGRIRTVFLAGVVLGLSVMKIGTVGIQDYFLQYLGAVFVPGVLILQLLMMVHGNERRKKRLTATALIFTLLFLSGCAGTEPEKRNYPLAFGIQEYAGGLKVSYGMPDLKKVTGQGKEEEGKNTSVLVLTGYDFKEIERKYNQSQEKYLDLGHLQVLLIEKKMLETGSFRKILSYLKEQKTVGENIYVFTAEDPEKILEWQKNAGVSVGKYLVEILEVDHYPKKNQGKTLRQVYHDWYQKNQLSGLPLVEVDDEELKITI